MIDVELQSVYMKVRRVIRSCKTLSQWEVSRNYAQLFLNRVPYLYAEQVKKNLTSYLIHRKQIIKLRSGIINNDII